MLEEIFGGTGHASYHETNWDGFFGRGDIRILTRVVERSNVVDLGSFARGTLGSIFAEAAKFLAAGAWPCAQASTTEFLRSGNLDLVTSFDVFCHFLRMRPLALRDSIVCSSPAGDLRALLPIPDLRTTTLRLTVSTYYRGISHQVEPRGFGSES